MNKLRDYAGFFDAVPIGLYRSTPEGRISEANPALLQMFGYTDKGEFLDLNASELYVDPEDQLTWRRMTREKGVVVNFEVRLRRRDGNVIWVRENSRAVMDAQGRVQCYEGSMEDITLQKATREALKASEARYRDLLENANDLIHSARADGHIEYVNRAWRETLGYSYDEAEKLTLKDILAPEIYDHCFEVLNRVLAGKVVKPIVATFIGKEGRRVAVEGNISCRHKGGRPHATVAVCRDVTQRKEAEKALAESEAQFRAIAAMAHDAIIMTDGNGRIVFWNPAAKDIFGFAAPEVYHKDAIALLAPPRFRKQYERGLRDFRNAIQGVAKGRTLELTGVKKDGSEFPLELSMSSVKVKDQWHTLGIVRDITRRKEMEEELLRLSYLDGLTGLANRRYFDDTLAREWRRSARDKTPLSIVMADIDLFKAYNDTYGHRQGDECLKQVAACIRSQLHRPWDMVGRYGGEEFVLILPSTDMKGALAVAKKIQAAIATLRLPHQASHVSTHVTLSQGVATGTVERSTSPEELVEAADKALYEAKVRGRNRVISASYGLHG